MPKRGWLTTVAVEDLDAFELAHDVILDADGNLGVVQRVVVDDRPYRVLLDAYLPGDARLSRGGRNRADMSPGLPVMFRGCAFRVNETPSTVHQVRLRREIGVEASPRKPTPRLDLLPGVLWQWVYMGWVGSPSNGRPKKQKGVGDDCSTTIRD